MAIPAYTTDLTTITEATGITGWDESSDAGWDDAGSMVDETNFYIQNGNCVSAQFTKDGVGTIMYNYGSNITVPTDGAILLWHFWASPPSLATLANGGVRVIAGDSFGDFDAWKCSGSDFEPSPLGGWYNFAYDPSLTADYTVGTPTTLSYFGIAVSATAQARGNPNAVDAIRYGRCDAVFAGGEVGDYATFAGFASVNDNTSNRWALLQKTSGGFKQQGLLSFGNATVGACDFRDANVNIFIADTINVSANFNSIKVYSTSNVEWTAVSITALGTTSKGNFDSGYATVYKDSCTFTDMDYFNYKDDNSTILNTTYRRCGLITLPSGASFTKCTVDAPSGAVGVYGYDLDYITDCTFNSSGTGHAVDLGDNPFTRTVNWDNTDTGYASTDGSTGNETFLINVESGQTVTINVVAGATTPTVYNVGPGTVIVLVGQVTTTITVKNQAGDAIYQARVYAVTESTGAYPSPPLADDTLIFNTLTDFAGQVSDIRSLASPQPIKGWARDSTGPDDFYKQSTITEVIDNSNGLNLNMLLILDE